MDPNWGSPGLLADYVFCGNCHFESCSYNGINYSFVLQIPKFLPKSMFQKMVLKRGPAGLLVDDVFFFNFSSLIGVLLVCLLSAGRPVDANRRETLLQ